MSEIESFESTWNRAEAVGKELEDPEDLDKAPSNAHIIGEIARRWNSTLEISEKNQMFGEMLFSLCQLARKENINSSAILKDIIEEKQAAILDPENED